MDAKTLLAFVAITAGCSENVNICSHGPEQPYIESAVNYWTAEGRLVTQDNDEACDVRARISVESYGPEGWGERDAEILVPDDGSLPSSWGLTGRLLFRSDTWETSGEAMRVYMATHELGHIWLGVEHAESGLMAAGATELEAELWLQGRVQ